MARYHGDGVPRRKHKYNCLLQYIRDKLAEADRDSSDLHPITSDDIVSTIAEVRRFKDSSRSEMVLEVKRRLANRNAPDSALSRAVDLAARLWLTTDIRSSPSGQLSGMLQWSERDSLVSLLQTSFQATPLAADEVRANVQSDLTMANLITNHEFMVRWTDNLAEHLLFDIDNRVLTVYEHKICLRNHHRFGDASALPRPILEEAIDTLNLLFPSDDRPTQLLLRRHKKTFHDLGLCGRPRSVETRRYLYWRRPIEALNTILHEAPTGRDQFVLKKDGKNALNVVNIWIAIAIGILTIVSFVTGVISAIYAQKAYDVAFLQYQLSLAQACSVPDAATLLPTFCS